MMKVLSTLLLLLLLSSSSSNVQAQTTCDFDGQIFQRGDNVASAFLNRCFAAETHVCVCNPDNLSQVDCLFCAFPTNSDILRCANHNQEVTFIDLDDVGQRCTCSVDSTTNVASSTCVEDPSVEQCSIMRDDGTIFTQPPGQQFGRQSRCGFTSDFPCICNPNVPNGIECPYCSFATKTQGLLCLTDGESRLFDNINGLRTECSCEIPFPFDLPIQECVTVPTAAPVVGPTTGCTLLDAATGLSVFVNDGDPLGDLAVSNCGSPEEWPCFCNVNLPPDQIECPYCEIPQADGSNVCQIRDEIATTINAKGQSQTCKCGGGDTLPTLECGAFPTPAPVVPVLDGCIVPGTNPTKMVGNMERFGQEVTGPCGSYLNWPSFCNLQLDNQVEYPYCQFTNTASASTLCAKDGQSVQYATDAGFSIICDCSYTSNDGAESSCRTVPTLAPISPTLEPSAAPVTRDVNVQGPSGAVVLALEVSLVLVLTVIVAVI
jgi:hypothetical protein